MENKIVDKHKVIRQFPPIIVKISTMIEQQHYIPTTFDGEFADGNLITFTVRLFADLFKQKEYKAEILVHEQVFHVKMSIHATNDHMRIVQADSMIRRLIVFNHFFFTLFIRRRNQLMLTIWCNSIQNSICASVVQFIALDLI